MVVARSGWDKMWSVKAETSIFGEWRISYEENNFLGHGGRVRLRELSPLEQGKRKEFRKKVEQKRNKMIRKVNLSK